MTLVAGVDSSTQSCKVVILDAVTGRVVRQGRAAHPDGSEVDPESWWSALRSAVDDAGGLADVDAVSVAGQQHGMVCLDDDGQVVRPALLWNDTRSAAAADDLVAELGGGDPVAGAAAWAQAVGTVPVASITATKLRWLADHEPEAAARVAAVALPHDWLTWRLLGGRDLDGLVTDRSDASGTGYFDAVSNAWRRDLLGLALRVDEDRADGIRLPRVLAPGEAAGRGDRALGLERLVVAAGCGDNAGAALGLGLEPGRTLVSIGTSGVVAAVSTTPTHDPSGVVAGFADATGHHLPLACTLNAARVLDSVATLLGVDHQGLSALALSAPPGADGLVFVPYLEGERTPNLPNARGQLHGVSLANLTPAHLARAAVEGLLGLLGGAIEGMRSQGVMVESVTITGGGSRSAAVRRLAPTVWGLPVHVPDPAEDVAVGAARQAAWALSGADRPPTWSARGGRTHTGEHLPQIQAAYDAAAARLAAT